MGPAPSSRQGKPESYPCHLATAVWVRKGTILSRLPALPREEGSPFLHFEATAYQGEPVGHLPSPAWECLLGSRAGPDLLWGTRASWYPEAEEAGTASSLGIGAEVSAPCGRSHRSLGERSGGGDSSIAGFLFSSLSASPSPPQARTMVQSHWLPCPPLL